MELCYIEVDPQIGLALEDRLFRRQYEKAKSLTELAADLRRARKSLAMTQGELAVRVGTTQSAISRFETASRGVTLEFASRVATALGTRVGVQPPNNFLP
jgi:DNA-binding XRE family transcriptional regulator